MLKGLAVLLSCQLAGEVATRLLHLPIPGAVLGLALLFLLLCWRGKASASLETASHALLENLALLFVPAGVGILSFLGLLRTAWVPVGAAILGSTLITLAATAAVLSAFLRSRQPEEREAGKASEFETELEQ